MKATDGEKKELKELLMDPNNPDDLRVIRQYRLLNNGFEFQSPEKIPPLPDGHVVSKVEIPDKDDLADEILKRTKKLRYNMSKGFDAFKMERQGIQYHTILRDRAEALADEKIKKYQEMNAKIDAKILSVMSALIEEEAKTSVANSQLQQMRTGEEEGWQVVGPKRKKLAKNKGR
jgi:hypothetical protein